MLTGKLEYAGQGDSGYLYRFIPISDEITYPFINGYDTGLNFALDTNPYLLETNALVKNFAREESFSVIEDGQAYLQLIYTGSYDLYEDKEGYRVEPFTYVRKDGNDLLCILETGNYGDDLLDNMFEVNEDNVREHLYNIFNGFIERYISEGVNEFYLGYEKKSTTYTVTFGYDFWGYTGTAYYDTLVRTLAKEGLYSSWKNRSANEGVLEVTFAYINR